MMEVEGTSLMTNNLTGGVAVAVAVVVVVVITLASSPVAFAVGVTDDEDLLDFSAFDICCRCCCLLVCCVWCGCDCVSVCGWDCGEYAT